MKTAYYYDLQFDRIGIAQEGEAITHLRFGGDALPADYELRETPLLKRAAEQLSEYFAGKRQAFELPLNPQGTVFQKRVWQALTEIPYGETRSYKEIAEQVGAPKGFRAVGGANNKNPIGIVIPCHRVIGANGALVGYAYGLSTKIRLLELEKLHRA